MSNKKSFFKKQRKCVREYARNCYYSKNGKAKSKEHYQNKIHRKVTRTNTKLLHNFF